MRGLILLGGDAPPAGLLKRRAAWADWIVAADSGITYALEEGLVPAMAVGDFDSADGQTVERARAMGCEVRVLPAVKDQTDGQEALDILLAMHCDEIVLLGGFGGRFDHQFAHLCLLARALGRGARAWMEDAVCSIECFGPGVADVGGKAGDLLSILPFGAGLHVESVEGLQYPINDKPLPVDFPYGVSNVMIGEAARIRIKSGLAVVVRIYTSDDAV